MARPLVNQLWYRVISHDGACPAGGEHNYIVHHIDGKTVYICSKCSHSIR